MGVVVMGNVRLYVHVNVWGLSLQVKLYESHSKAMMKDQSQLQMEGSEASTKAGLSHVFQVSHCHSSFMCWGIYVCSCACLPLDVCVHLCPS